MYPVRNIIICPDGRDASICSRTFLHSDPILQPNKAAKLQLQQPTSTPPPNRQLSELSGIRRTCQNPFSLQLLSRVGDYRAAFTPQQGRVWEAVACDRGLKGGFRTRRALGAPGGNTAARRRAACADLPPHPAICTSKQNAAGHHPPAADGMGYVV